IPAALGWLGLGLLIGAAVGYTAATPFPGLAALLPVGGTVLVLRAGARNAAGGPRPMLATRSLQWIGKRSYSWYLWHWPVWIAGGILWPHMPLAGRVLLGGVALGLAAGTYRAVERPMRDARRWRHAPGRILVAGLVTSAALVGVAGLVRALGTTLEGRPDQRTMAAAVTDFPALYAAGCGEDAADAPMVRVCTRGAATGTTTVVLFGDSHAAQWAPAFERLAQDRKWRLLVITKSSCATADVAVYSWPLQREFTECAIWRQAALDTIRRRHPQLVVLANARDYLGPRPDGRPTLTTAAWAAGLTRTLDTLAAAGVPVVVLRDTPALGFDGPTCLARFALLRRARPACATPVGVALNAALSQAERAAVGGVPLDRYVDLTAGLCPDAMCPAELDQQVVYRDDNHLTATFAASLTAALAQALGAVPTLQAHVRWHRVIDWLPSSPGSIPEHRGAHNENQVQES
ncbi:MAG TPA: SGNH hydrolase domain-containing protein, partial [Gemmatimonadaceae bacterium]